MLLRFFYLEYNKDVETTYGIRAIPLFLLHYIILCAIMNKLQNYKQNNALIIMGGILSVNNSSCRSQTVKKHRLNLHAEINQSMFVVL